MEAMQKIKCLTIEDSNFPDRLRKLSGMPKKLYFRHFCRVGVCKERAVHISYSPVNDGLINGLQYWSVVCQ